MALAAWAASIRSWSVMAMTSSSVLRSTWSRISTTPAVPSDASVWMCRSARPRRSVIGRSSRGFPYLARAGPGLRRGPGSGAFVGRHGLEIRPDRVEDGEPLLRRRGDVALERPRLRLQVARDPLAPGTVRRERHLLGPAVVHAGLVAPDTEHVGRHARLHGQERRPGGERRAGAEQLHLDAPARDVAIAEDADRLPLPQRIGEPSLRAGQLDELEAQLGPRPHQEGLQLRIVDRLRGHERGPPRPCRRVHGRELEPAEVHAHEQRALRVVEGGVDDAPILDHEPALEVGRIDERRASELDVVPRGIAEGVPDESIERAPVAGGRAGSGRAQLVISEPPADPRQVLPGAHPPFGSEAVPDAPGEVRQREERPLRQAAREPRRGNDGPGADPATKGARLPPRGHPPAGTRVPPARSARTACSSTVDGQSGLKLYHCSGAAAIVAPSASAMAWVARCSSAGSEDRTWIGSLCVTTYDFRSSERRMAMGR